MTARGTISRNGNGTVRFATQCTWCSKPSALDQLDPSALDAYLEGRLSAETLFPGLSASEREVLISGTHAECWDAMFPPEVEGA